MSLPSIAYFKCKLESVERSMKTWPSALNLLFEFLFGEADTPAHFPVKKPDHKLRG